MRDRSGSVSVVSRLPVPAVASGYEYAPLSTTPESGSPSNPSLLAFPPTPSSEEPPASPWRTSFTPQHQKAPAGRVKLRRTLLLAAGALVAISLFLLAPTSLSARLLSSDTDAAAAKDAASAPEHAAPAPAAKLAPASAVAPVQRTCPAREWSAGSWVPKSPPLTPNTTVVDVLSASGFTGVTQDWFKPHWFLHSKPGDFLHMDEYRWRAAQWMWEAGSEMCREEVRPSEGQELLRELVERGGWIILGDSLAEQHFFSLGCVLFPHVYVVWGAGWWEQHMYLKPDASILATLDLPASFNIATTPLISNLRTDHGFTKPELVSIYEATPQSAETPVSQLFTDYPVQSPPIDEYLARFFAPEHNYHALVFSTAAHFTPREFAFPEGQPAIAPFYEAVVRRWVDEARNALERDEGGTREIIVRGASSGHDQCHDRLEGPLNKTETPSQESYNWGEIPRYNDVFEGIVKEANHSRLSYLALERPSQLRPDAHSEDCLHFAVGTGVFEGWTDYIAYFLRSRWRVGAV
ncbi:hypothetical protein JCM10450v2_000213 [Rhodotorula kratochvilovae]